MNIRCSRAVLAVLLLASACSFERRSSGYSCESSSECGAGRLCQRGWCVEDGTGDGDGGGPVIDADPNAPDARIGPDAAFVCPETCDSCDDVNGRPRCIIRCDESDPCNDAEVTCPIDLCKIECLSSGSCAAGIDCSSASVCFIECSGQDSCGGAITCGEGNCTVECTATGTCAGGIDCDQACACLTDCSGSGSCAIAPDCPGTCESGGPAPHDCVISGPNCNSCGA